MATISVGVLSVFAAFIDSFAQLRRIYTELQMSMHVLLIKNESTCLRHSSATLVPVENRRHLVPDLCNSIEDV